MGAFVSAGGRDFRGGTDERVQAGARARPVVKEAEKPGQQLGFDIGDRERGGNETVPAGECCLCRRGDGGGGFLTWVMGGGALIGRLGRGGRSAAVLC